MNEESILVFDPVEELPSSVNLVFFLFLFIICSMNEIVELSHLLKEINQPSKIKMIFKIMSINKL